MPSGVKKVGGSFTGCHGGKIKVLPATQKAAKASDLGLKRPHKDQPQTMFKTSRRTHLHLALGAVLACLGPLRLAHAAPHTLPIATALDEDLARAVKQGKPLVVRL